MNRTFSNGKKVVGRRGSVLVLGAVAPDVVGSWKLGGLDLVGVIVAEK